MSDWNIATTANADGTNDYTLTINLRHEDNVRLLAEYDISPKYADTFAKDVLLALVEGDLGEEIKYFLRDEFPKTYEEEGSEEEDVALEEDNVAPKEEPAAEEPGDWKPLPTWKGEVDWLYEDHCLCPRCGSDDIDFGQSDGDDDGEAQECECHRCGQEWTATYSRVFTGIYF